MSRQGSAGNVLAALCSFFIPGLGQLLQARLGTAIFHFLLAAVLWFVLLGWIIHLWSILDAATFDPARDSKNHKFDIKEYERRKSFDSEIIGVRESILTAESLTDRKERIKGLSQAKEKLAGIKSRFEQYPVFSVAKYPSWNLI